MSSRRTLNKSEGSSNPATLFLEWKSNDKCFCYYDKEAKEKVNIELPLKIQFLEHFHTVKGWHDASQSGIYSNEVKFISKEPLEVKSFKGGPVANGFYKDIKGVVNGSGGKYHRSIYALYNGEIINIAIKGAAVSAYSDFMATNEGKTEGAFMEVKEALDQKKGSIKYSTPVFTIGKSFTKPEMELANDKYSEIVDYFDTYTKKEAVEPEEITEDDLEF